MSKRPRSPEDERQVDTEAAPRQRIEKYVDELGDSDGDDVDDLFPSSTSSTASDAGSGDGDGGDRDRSDEEAAKLRLMIHAQAAGSALAAGRAAAANTSNGKSLASTLQGAQSKSGAVAAALEKLRAELTRPVVSTALTVVDAADEALEVQRQLAQTKIPPPPAGEQKKLRALKYVDHSTMSYPPIRKDFFVVQPDMKHLSEEELRQLYKQLDGAKVRSGRAPRPLTRWDGVGLPPAVMELLEARGYAAPFAVQSLGIPALMSGSDLLITAKTGSGKTLCYVLPMVRHCAAQSRCQPGEGPIGLVLVPTQELAAQVFEVLEDFGSAVGLRCVPSYGSTSLSENITAAKLGSDVMVATPGRLLDLLTVNTGRVLTLSRTSFVVVDEADRLFDNGFAEHVVAFLKNARPDRQVAMISATLPRELKKIILAHMHSPVEISVGGKAAPASNVEQVFYFFDEAVYETDESKRTEDPRFVRLMQLLGEESPNGDRLVLVFTQRREEVDELFMRLSGLGYEKRIATLYSGMDPIDREFALEHFKPGKQFILLSTGVAERGLDISGLELVVNYYLPDHYEAFVHRIGRTGRAGRPGKAVSFFTRGKDDDIAPELVDGLERAGQQVPEELYDTANRVAELRKSGQARYNAGFYRGYGRAKRQRFTDRDRKEQMRAAARATGLEDYLSSSSSSADGGSSADDDDEGDRDIIAVDSKGNAVGPEAPGASSADGSGGSRSVALSRFSASNALTRAVRRGEEEDRVAKALEYARKTSDVAAAVAAGGADRDNAIRFQVKYVVNDLPDAVRNRLQSGSMLRALAEETNTSIVKKGFYFDPRYKHSHRMKEGEEPLYLLITGPTTEAVREVKTRLNALKEEILSKQQKKASSFGTL